MIPEKIAVTFCELCDAMLTSHPGVEPFRSGLCTPKCRYDGNTTRERPVKIVTYWQREDVPPGPRDPDPLHSFLPNLQR